MPFLSRVDAGIGGAQIIARSRKRDNINAGQRKLLSVVRRRSSIGRRSVVIGSRSSAGGGRQLAIGRGLTGEGLHRVARPSAGTGGGLQTVPSDWFNVGRIEAARIPFLPAFFDLV